MRKELKGGYIENFSMNYKENEDEILCKDFHNSLKLIESFKLRSATLIKGEVSIVVERLTDDFIDFTVSNAKNGERYHRGFKNSKEFLEDEFLLFKSDKLNHFVDVLLGTPTKERVKRQGYGYIVIEFAKGDEVSLNHYFKKFLKSFFKGEFFYFNIEYDNLSFLLLKGYDIRLEILRDWKKMEFKYKFCEEPVTEKDIMKVLSILKGEENKSLNNFLDALTKE